MNYRGLKRAARQCLTDSGVSPRKLTLLFLLCLYAVSFPCDVISYLLETRLDGLSGLNAAADRSRYEMWVYGSSLLVTLLTIPWDAGYTAFAIRLSRGQPVGFRDFAAGFRLFGKVLALSFLEIFYISLWSMLFVIPGLVAAYRYRMALYILLDDPSIPVSEAIRVSKRLTYGHKLELFLLDLSFWWYALPSALMMSLSELAALGYLPALQTDQASLLLSAASIVVTIVMDTLFRPYIATTCAHAYNWLRSLDHTRIHAAHEPFNF